MNKRDVLAKIEEKKDEIKKFIEVDDLENAKKEQKELENLQAKYDILEEIEGEELGNVAANAANGKVKQVAKKEKSVVAALVNAIRAGFKKKPVAEEDMEILNKMQSGIDEDGGLTVPKDISTNIRTLRRSEDALETLVRTEHVTMVKGSRVYEINADSVPFDAVDEDSVFPEVGTPTLKKIEYAIVKFGGILKMTYEILQDSDENIISYLTRWIAKKCKATRNGLILKKLNEMTAGFEEEITNLDGLKNIFNVILDTAIAAGAKVLTNQSGFNWLDKLKDSDGNYILQRDPGNATRRLLFGVYPVTVVSNKTLKNSADGKVPLFCGNFEEAITLFDRENMTINISSEAGDLWEKDNTGIKVRERLDCQIVDDTAIVKAEVPKEAISEPVKKYRKSELEGMTVEEIKELATTLKYTTVTGSKKEEVMQQFLTEQSK